MEKKFEKLSSELLDEVTGGLVYAQAKEAKLGKEAGLAKEAKLGKEAGLAKEAKLGKDAKEAAYRKIAKHPKPRRPGNP